MIVSDSPGFVVNCLLIRMINDAFAPLDEDVAKPDNIDLAMKTGSDQPIAPLRLADLIGLDVCPAILESLHDRPSSDRYLPPASLRRYVSEGRLGRKAGRGVYEYR
ncbi:3-hydroxyacyl-CoA dehydrogenase family protein [Paraburkholderia dipogonis]